MFLEHNSNIVLEILEIIMLCKHNVSEAYFILRQMPVSYFLPCRAFARYREIDEDMKRDLVSMLE